MSRESIVQFSCVHLTITTDVNSYRQAITQLATGQFSSLTFDLSHLSEFIRPRHIAYWRCIIESATNQDVALEVLLPQDRFAGYAGRMGLFKGTNYEYPYRKYSSHTFFELTKIGSDRNGDLYEKIARILSNSAYSSRIADFFNAIVELTDNIYYHSGPDVDSGWGFVVGQVLPISRHICLGICDPGVGFLGSYARFNRVNGRSEELLLRHSFENKESCMTGQDPSRGQGLTFARDFCERFGGWLEITSGTAYVRCNRGGLNSNTINQAAVGTIIEVAIPL